MSGAINVEFRNRLVAGEALIGTWVKTPSPVLCEVLAGTDLDVLCLDAEHSPFGRVELDGCLAVAHALGKPALVRVPSADPAQILNALDCGASGVVVPHVRTATEATAIARASHYGPGGRGFAGSTRAADFTSRPMSQHLAASAEQTTVIAQIEDIEALDDIEAIARVEGIDCLFVGRADLTVSMGAPSVDDARVIAAVEKVCAAGRSAGKAVGMFVPRPADAGEWRKKGASLFLLSSDQSFVKAGANALARGFREG